MKTQCSICDGITSVEGTVELTEIITCPECKGRLEVVEINAKTKTMKVKQAPKIEEDWGE